LVVTLSAGVLAGVAAMLGIWPFSGLQVLATQLVHGDAPAMIQAHSLFPPVAPVHKTVDVYDPPRPQPAPPNPPSHPSPKPEPSPSPDHDPSPSPGGGDE
jgi:outer membrane biosynthesis protein TonB